MAQAFLPVLVLIFSPSFEEWLRAMLTLFDKVQHRQECLCYRFPKLMHTMPSRINPTPANLVRVSFS